MKRLLNAAVVVAALGYFVDSLRSIGYAGRELWSASWRIFQFEVWKNRSERI